MLRILGVTMTRQKVTNRSGSVGRADYFSCNGNHGLPARHAGAHVRRAARAGRIGRARSGPGQRHRARVTQLDRPGLPVHRGWRGPHRAGPAHPVAVAADPVGGAIALAPDARRRPASAGPPPCCSASGRSSRTSPRGRWASPVTPETWATGATGGNRLAVRRGRAGRAEPHRAGRHLAELPAGRTQFGPAAVADPPGLRSGELAPALTLTAPEVTRECYLRDNDPCGSCRSGRRSFV